MIDYIIAAVCYLFIWMMVLCALVGIAIALLVALLVFLFV